MISLNQTMIPGFGRSEVVIKFEPVAPPKLETLLQLSDALCGSAQQTAQAHVVPQHWAGSKATKRYGKSMGNPWKIQNPWEIHDNPWFPW